eukprot:351548-Chlamydomonas_euryale.AAC.10
MGARGGQELRGSESGPSCPTVRTAHELGRDRRATAAPCPTLKARAQNPPKLVDVQTRRIDRGCSKASRRFAATRAGSTPVRVAAKRLTRKLNHRISFNSV